MDRKEIKELAKSKIKGNLWNLLWPMIILSLIESLVTRIFVPTQNIDYTSFETIIESSKMSPSASAITAIISIIVGIIAAGYLKYVVEFVRKGKFDTKIILDTVKEKWLNILVAELLMSILIGLASLLLVIPGIILAFAYAMVSYLVVDTDLSGVDSLKKSREMMKGYKFDYFVFCLSFIGWMLLAPFTLFILLIWLVPYITVAETIYYDKLKAKTK